MSQVDRAPEGAVVISYSTLLSSPATLLPSIEEAFGSHPNALGIIVVRDLPPVYTQYRERLLKLAYQFGNLPESVRETFTDPTSKYSFGWSHGKEIMNGKPDTLKGSYYANPIGTDKPVSAEEVAEFPEYFGKNIWPTNQKGVEGFEEAFLNLSRFIYSVGLDLAGACQPFASKHLKTSTVTLADLIRDSQTTKARLLHYFPPPPTSSPVSDEPIDSWCGFHLDHSLLTGLCPALFLRRKDGGEPVVIKNPASKSGLYIRNRGGDLVKVSIPADCLAFQTGEALEVATDGRLLATPHCVRVGTFSGTEEVSRESFALFMQPHTSHRLSADLTFGQFSKKIFSEHYEEATM